MVMCNKKRLLDEEIIIVVVKLIKSLKRQFTL